MLNRIYRLFWLVLVLLVIFLDRQNHYWVIATILLLLLLSTLAVLRSLESRNQWRTFIKEESLDDDIP
ncbi:uncharacterized protein METZ01_LOCUS155307 [marine metagenome]|uniref:Uncharacterized protein n=1 Tax=marine metagenome TaxID=408172 RepID=A0A382AN69_9ZZZZ